MSNTVNQKNKKNNDSSGTQNKTIQKPTKKTPKKASTKMLHTKSSKRPASNTKTTQVLIQAVSEKPNGIIVPETERPSIKPSTESDEVISKPEKPDLTASSSHTATLNLTQESMIAKSSKKQYKTLNVVSRVLAGVAIVSFIILIVSIIRLNILPTKYLIIVIGSMVILTLINLFFAFFKKKPPVFRPISIVLSILFSAISIFAFLKINDTINFFANFGSDKITNTYNVIVAKDSELGEDSDLANKTIYAYRDLTIDQDLIIDAIKNNYNANTEFIDNVLTLATDLMNNTEKIGVINAGTLEAFLSDNNLYEDSFRIIKSFDIITETEQSHEVDITKDPFVIFLSGIDTRSGTLPSRSLSDVNIVATINPKDHKILLTTIPRDYYVHLAGTPEDSLNDKLTHAGSQGGIALSKATIEELLGIEINYYARVNFNFVQNLVDAIGGIDIDPGVDYSFTCWTDRGCTFHPGINSVGGRCALAYARERKSFAEGDINRGEHQEQVIGLILDKISNSSTLLASYSDILASLSGTFETNIESDDITTFFKNQLENMKPWKIDNLNLKGEGVMDVTYSYPYQNLFVMYPDESTIEAAKAKIYEYLGKEYKSPEPSTESEPTD